MRARAADSAKSTRTSVTLPHHIQQASAGTGKTFALSNRFLRLLAIGAPPETILAATFTRKGAGEIMDRVMMRLGDAAASESRASELGRFLEVDLNAAGALRLLRTISENLHRLQIGTIDSYFHRLARVLSLELGLPLDWEIGANTEVAVLAAESLSAMLGDEQVIELWHLLARGEADRSVAEQMQHAIHGAYELYLESTPAAWSRWAEKSQVTEDDIRAFLDHWETIPIDKQQLRERYETDLAFVRSAAWEDLAKSTALLNVHRGHHQFGRSKIPDELVEAYVQLAALVARGVTQIYAERTQAAGGLAGRFAAEIGSRQRRLGMLGFSDVTRLLNEVAADIDTLARTRLDAVIDHVLLDEFQDTSAGQWRVLAPLVYRITAPGAGGSFYCVGDKKQAIYGWRGGLAEMFDVVEKRLSDRLTPCPPLVDSRRSAQPIIDTVNRVFQSLSQAKDERPDGQGVLNGMADAFPHHRTARGDLRGYAALEQVNSGDEGAADAVLSCALKHVERVHREIPWATVGVLLRGNDPIAWLVQQLHARGIPASEEGGNPLTDSAAVDQILSALQLIDHPQDGPARFHVSHGPLAVEFGLTPESQETIGTNQRRVQGTAAAWRRRLSEIGLSRVLAGWAATLAPACTPRERLRLQQLIELAEANEAIGVERPSRFVEFVFATPVYEQSAAQVRVMTIHGSKGLEFDVVIAPMLQHRSGWSPRPPSYVSHRPAPDQPIDGVLRYAGEQVQQFLPRDARDLFAEGYQAQVRDELCVLYVMMTRAVHELRLLVSDKAKATQAGPVGAVLATLGNSAASRDGLLYAHGDPHWHQSATSGPTEAQTDPDLAMFYLPDEVDLPHLNAPARRSAASERAPLPAPGAARWRRIPRLGDARGRRARQVQGRLLHACFELIEWMTAEDWQLAHSVQASSGMMPQVAEVARRFHLSDERQRELDILFREALRSEPAQWLFDRERYVSGLLQRLPKLAGMAPDDCDVKISRELRMVGKDANGMWGEGIADRVAVVFCGGDAVAAHVVDYKTEWFPRRRIEREAARYTGQLAGYREMVAGLNGLELALVPADLFFTTHGALFAVEQTRREN